MQDGNQQGLKGSEKQDAGSSVQGDCSQYSSRWEGVLGEAQASWEKLRGAEGGREGRSLRKLDPRRRESPWPSKPDSESTFEARGSQDREKCPRELGQKEGYNNVLPAKLYRGFLGGPVLKLCSSNAGGAGLIP